MQEYFFNNILPLTLLQGFEKDYSKFACERELETEQKLQYFDRQRCVFLVLLWTPIQSGLPRAPSAGCGFPYYISSPTSSDLQLNCIDFCLDWAI